MLAGRSLLDTGPRELLSGTVERVTFHSEESGFAVLRVAVRGRRDFVTVVGQAARTSAGEAIQASGSWVNDSTHGLQFKAAHLQTAAPTTAEGMERFLGSGLVKGIGPGLARRLVAAFGPEVFDVIEQKIALIRARAGISYALTEAMDDGHCGPAPGRTPRAGRETPGGRAAHPPGGPHLPVNSFAMAGASKTFVIASVSALEWTATARPFSSV
jgi:hypothetical protein